MQTTICAKVNERLLSKASRLFAGKLDGRIIEILQNSRRAGSMEVRISNKDGFVIVLVYVTEVARLQLDYNNLWYHLGGYNDEGDTYETQQYYVEKDLDEFWAALIGPYEKLRQPLVSEINLNHGLHDKWSRVVATDDGTIAIHFKDGHLETVKPPEKG